MNLNDPVGDLITRIRNAQRQRMDQKREAEYHDDAEYGGESDR